MGGWLFIIGVVGFFLWLAYVETVTDHAASKRKERDRARKLKGEPEPSQAVRDAEEKKDLREGRKWGVLIAVLILIVNVAGGFLLLPLTIAYLVAMAVVLGIIILLLWPFIGWD